MLYICGVGVVAVAAALFLDRVVLPTLTKKPAGSFLCLVDDLDTGQMLFASRRALGLVP